jgi:hypothetical protein
MEDLNIIKTKAMPDITMCKGISCPIKEECYRYTAKADEFYQAYFSESPIADNKCEMYWGKQATSIWNQLKDITKVIKPK